tara:strand:- start:1129 stop:1533 length:405 start_codon:yes stop_codon:yes gene_type:complete
MENTILRAKLILSDYFKINIIHFDKHVCRDLLVVEARRFLIYFLRNELDCTYQEICKFCPSITNHATAIHHYKRMKGFLKNDKKIEKHYINFLSKILGSEDLLIENEVMILNNERKLLNNKITKLKLLLYENNN